MKASKIGNVAASKIHKNIKIFIIFVSLDRAWLKVNGRI